MTWNQVLEFLMIPYGYAMSFGVFVIAVGTLNHFEEVIGVKGIVKYLIAIVVAVLFFNFGDDVALKFHEFLQYLGLEQYEPGTYGNG